MGDDSCAPSANSPADESLEQDNKPPAAKKRGPGRPRKTPLIPEDAPTADKVAQQEEVESDEDVPPKVKYSEEIIKEDLQDSQANRDMRVKYAEKAYDLAWDSITFMFALVAGVAVWAAISGKQVISDKLFFALITGVTVNVLAAFLGVIRGLFPHLHVGKKSKRKKG